MKLRASWLLLLLLAGTGVGAGAAVPGHNADPDWPCQQIKVPELSVGAMWTGPSIDAYRTTWSQDPQVAGLAARLMQRRLPTEQATAEIAAFAEQAGAQKQAKLLALFAGVFADASQERDSILAGLDRFGRRQKELATAIRAESEKLHGPPSATETDVAPTAGLQNRLQWDLKVFQDRRESLGYACQAPGLVEQRLFALARAIQAQLPQTAAQ